MLQKPPQKEIGRKRRGRDSNPMRKRMTKLGVVLTLWVARDRANNWRASVT
jgi:hypothetical protein